MEFSGKLNATEAKEAVRLARPKGYKWKMALNNVRLAFYAVAAVALLWISITKHASIPPQILWTRVGILLFLIGFAVFRYKKGSRDAVASLDRKLPDSLTLSAEGVRHRGPHGADGFQPWATYAGWIEGQHIVLLRRVEKDLFSVLPVSALASGEREALRGALRSWLPGSAK